MPLLEQVLEKYPREVKVVFKNYPLRGHGFAKQAAIAALAAGEQGKFWEFHDMLFDNYNKLSAGTIREIALALGLDMKRFDESMRDSDIEALIERDMRDAARAGVRGTPTIFVNGRLLTNRSLDGFRVSVESELNRLNDGGAKVPVVR